MDTGTTAPQNTATTTGRYCRHCGQPIRQALRWVHDHHGETDCRPCGSPPASPHPPPPADDAAPDGGRREAGDRWHIGTVTGGYAAIPHHQAPGRAPCYGRTPGELAESIRFAEGRM